MDLYQVHLFNFHCHVYTPKYGVLDVFAQARCKYDSVVCYKLYGATFKAKFDRNEGGSQPCHTLRPSATAAMTTVVVCQISQLPVG